MDLGTRIRAERERLALSREDLIRLMGDLRMDRNTLWHIEAGRTKNPRADQIIALAKALNVSADYILGLSDEPQPPAKRPRPRKAASVG
jgi:transcriptional regulator with XRE-family HTH domain